MTKHEIQKLKYKAAIKKAGIHVNLRNKAETQRLINVIKNWDNIR